MSLSALSYRRSALVSFAAVAVAGWLLRAILIAAIGGAQNSDEAVTGLQALELTRGHAWVFVPGNTYGGNAEAWLDAPFAWLFGASVLRLKLESSLLWLGAASLLALALRSRGFGPALFAFAAVWLPSAAVMLVSTRSYLGYGAGLLAACAAIGLAVPLLDGSAGRTPTARHSFALGLAAALAVWMHPLFFLTVAAFAGAVAWRHRRCVKGVLAPLVAGGLLGMAVPLLENLRTGFASLDQPVVPLDPYPVRVQNWFTDLFPRALGQKWEGSWVVSDLPQQILTVAVLAAALVVVVVVLRRGRASMRVAAWVLLASPFVLPLFGSTTYYTADGRYFIMMLPSAAVVIAEGLSLLAGERLRGVWPLVLVTAWTLLAVALPFSARLSDAVSDHEQDLDGLVASLRREHIETVRADYWIAYRLAYATDERIVGSPTSTVRFPSYENRVRAAEARGTAALVLFNDQVATLDAGLPPFDRHAAYRSYRRKEVGVWTVFFPAAPANGG